MININTNRMINYNTTKPMFLSNHPNQEQDQRGQKEHKNRTHMTIKDVPKQTRTKDDQGKINYGFGGDF